MNSHSTYECFLCEPDKKLIIREGESIRVLAGLGPLTDIYCVAASKRHDKSLADLAIRSPESVKELEIFRVILEKKFGSILLTEHGRVPVCRDDGDDHDVHCFHAHALIFSTQSNVEDSAEKYYSEKLTFISLSQALEYAGTKDHYLLVSSSSQRYVVLSGALNAPRQLVRNLVAYLSGNVGDADWRQAPRYTEALAMATKLRAEFGNANE